MRTVGRKNIFHLRYIASCTLYDSIGIKFIHRQNECRQRDARTAVTCLGRAGNRRDKRGYRGAVMFSFWIWVEITWVCSGDENPARCRLMTLQFL